MNFIKITGIYFLFAISIFACKSEPKNETAAAKEPTEAAAQTPVEKGKTQAEGMVSGVSYAKLLLKDKNAIDLPELEDKSAVTIFLVRHAETIEGKTSISQEGLARAAQLATKLGGAGIIQVYVDGNAGMQTTMPVRGANESDLKIFRFDGSDELTKTITHNYKGRRVLMAGKAETITGMLNQLAGEDKYFVPQNEYDNLFLAIVRDSLTEIHHLKY